MTTNQENHLSGYTGRADESKKLIDFIASMTLCSGAVFRCVLLSRVAAWCLN